MSDTHTTTNPDHDEAAVLYRYRLGQRLKHMREWDNQHGRKLGTEEVAAMLNAHVPAAMQMSRSKIVNIEKGQNATDPRDIELLCAFYGHDLSEIAPELTAEIRRVNSYVASNKGKNSFSDGFAQAA